MDGQEVAETLRASIGKPKEDDRRAVGGREGEQSWKVQVHGDHHPAFVLRTRKEEDIGCLGKRCLSRMVALVATGAQPRHKAQRDRDIGKKLHGAGVRGR